jgi:hypothetical protein
VWQQQTFLKKVEREKGKHAMVSIPLLAEIS